MSLELIIPQSKEGERCLNELRHSKGSIKQRLLRLKSMVKRDPNGYCFDVAYVNWFASIHF